MPNSNFMCKSGEEAPYMPTYAKQVAKMEKKSKGRRENKADKPDAKQMKATHGCVITIAYL